MHLLDSTIIDYGCGNLLSVKRSVEKVGGAAHISSDPKVIEQSKIGHKQ